MCYYLGKFIKGERVLLQKVVEYLVQNPDEKEKLIEGKLNLIGLTKIEQKAVLDVLQSPDVISPLLYW